MTKYLKIQLPSSDGRNEDDGAKQSELQFTAGLLYSEACVQQAVGEV